MGRLVTGGCHLLFYVFFFNDTATTEIYTLSLHDALPIYDGGEEIEFDPVFTELEIVMETVTNGEITATAELGGEAANELRYGLWWLYEMMTGGEMDEANATINMTVVAAFITLMSGGQEEVDSGFQLNGVNGTVVPGIPSISPMDALPRRAACRCRPRTYRGCAPRGSRP